MWYGGCPKVGSVIALDRFTIERCEVLGGDRKLGEGLQIELEQFQGDGLMQVIENYGSGDFYLEKNPWFCVVSFKARKQRKISSLSYSEGWFGTFSRDVEPW